MSALSFEVLTHTLTPPNDGSISLGQVAVAAARMAREGKDGNKPKGGKKDKLFDSLSTVAHNSGNRDNSEK